MPSRAVRGRPLRIFRQVRPRLHAGPGRGLDAAERRDRNASGDPRLFFAPASRLRKAACRHRRCLRPPSAGRVPRPPTCRAAPGPACHRPSPYAPSARCLPRVSIPARDRQATHCAVGVGAGDPLRATRDGIARRRARSSGRLRADPPTERGRQVARYGTASAPPGRPPGPPVWAHPSGVVKSPATTSTPWINRFRVKVGSFEGLAVATADDI
jgi:hypothetical protein